MNPFAWLLGLLLPACGAIGAQGLPVPPLMDTDAITRPSSPNTALAAPADFLPKPDLITPVYDVPADRMYTFLRTTMEAQPRVFVAAAYDDRRQVHYVARSATLNFPDMVMAEVRVVAPDQSKVVLYSRSVYGHSDFGVNRSRLESWMSLLRQQPVAAESTQHSR